MSKLKEGIAEILQESFEGFAVYTDQQDFVEPFFYIQQVEGSREQIIGNRYYENRRMDIEIHSGTMDEDDVISGLYEILEYVHEEESLIRGTKMQDIVKDGVLHFFVNYNRIIFKVQDADPMMEEMDVII